MPAIAILEGHVHSMALHRWNEYRRSKDESDSQQAASIVKGTAAQAGSQFGSLSLSNVVIFSHFESP